MVDHAGFILKSHKLQEKFSGDTVKNSEPSSTQKPIHIPLKVSFVTAYLFDIYFFRSSSLLTQIIKNYECCSEI